MKSERSPFCLPPRWRWIVLPVLGLAVGGAVAGVWLSEEPLVVAGEACLALAALAGLYAVVCGFFHSVFKAKSPSRKDAHQRLPKGN